MPPLFRAMMRFFMAIHIRLYRLTGGRFGGRVQGLRVLLLTTTGRKSGARRTTPLGYFEDAEAYVIVASNAGFETHPAWFHNLKANPRARIEAEGRTLEVAAEVAGSDERGRLWARLLELSPGYGRYAERTRREIPLVRLRPAPG